ncbi:NADH-quinone oxidoreductase subunit F [Azospirillum sp. TSO35-2]|nr:NAD(P)H-dependent oxidoreductase subunit E [Azospirillum sp. TSO35-2]PWC31375.1 NADH-quinone oxidoreductase subunit F [Azospirillum sp. TSO35-2]
MTIPTPPLGQVPARSIHPGSGRRKTRDHQKGRQVDPLSLDEVRALLGDRSRQPDLLIEHLHLLQDHYGCLHARHLAALAKEMRLALVEVYEVASFYAHFDIVMDGEPAPPKITIRVCDSLSCALAGAEQLLDALKAGVDEREVRVVRAPCMGGCDKAPVTAIGHSLHENATVDSVLDAVAHGHTRPDIPDYIGLSDYIRNGGYKMLAECLNGARDVDGVLKGLEDSSIRGLGGAGFPTGLKWRYVRAEPGPRMMAINGDEGEPGTFKDRYHLERDPHRFLEGMLIGAWTVEATDVYIYLRDEYPQCREILLREIPKIEAAGFSPHTRIHLRRGAGAYICGEESAMLESIEGKRGLPRHKPPFPSVVGLFGRPTLINNIETVFWVREILEKGGAWFASHGANGRKGLRTFSVSGRVKEPGVKLAPAGTTLLELVENYCGGMADGHTLKGYLPGGPSGGILPASMANIPLDFGTLEPHGSFIGSAAVIVLSDKDNMRDVALNLLKFFEDESCGQCTPCRVGTEKAVRLISQPEWDEELLAALGKVMGDASICGLGQAAMNPIKQVMKHFRDDFVSRQSADGQSADGSKG